MMADWKELTVGDLCDTISDTYRRKDEKVILVNTSDVLEGKILNHECVENKNLKGQFKKTFKKDDILYSEIRPANKRYAYVDFEETECYIASTKLMVLRPKTEVVLPRFLFAFLTSNYVLAELQHLAETRSGTFPQITFSSELAPLPIAVPDFETQEKIVGMLSSIEGRIQNNNAINENLLEQAQTIFTEEFLSLDGIPEGWSESSLLGIANYLNGLAMQKFRPSDDEQGLPVLKIKELRQGSCDANSELCSPSIKPEYIVHDGDVIFSWSGSLLVDFWCGGTCGLNQHLFKVTSNKYAKWFYFAWTNHHLQKFAAIAADMATTMGHIKREELAKAEVLIPSQSDYNRIDGILAPLYDLVIANRIENRKLASLRDDLLPQLMSGQLDVSEVSL